MKNLVMITLKQDKLATINTLATYDPSKTTFPGNIEYPRFFIRFLYFLMMTADHFISITNAKQIIKHYHLNESILHFQVMLTDLNNIVFPTNHCCATIKLTEYKGRSHLEQLRH